MNIKRFLTKQIIVISLSIFCLLAVIISTSYASFTSSSSNVSRTIQAGDLTVDFTKGNEIEIPSAPVSETDGWTYFNNEENYYHFTITNNGTLPAYYRIDLHSEFGE